MKITDLTNKTEKTIETKFILDSNLQVSIIDDNNFNIAQECILLDTEQEYYYDNKKYILDLMYFKFENIQANCLVLGKFNDGIIE